jgi:small basic protein (TIGR04137 family)
MSIHPSLATSDKDKKQRSVLKRTERIRMMHEKGQWKEGDPVYGLPKIKTVRIRIKKEKAEKAETAAAGQETAAVIPTTEAKESTAPAKGPAGRLAEKK